MNAADVGATIGAFAAAIGVGALWLLMAYAIPPLRRRPHISYPVAMVLAAVVAVIPIGGPTGATVGGSALCIALLFWQMRRAQRRLTLSVKQAQASVG